MIILENYVPGWKSVFSNTGDLSPWEITDGLENILMQILKGLDSDYNIENNIAVHKSTTIEQNVVLKGTMIISEGCNISANAYLRGPLFLGKSVKIGPGSEIKQSIIFDNSVLAHFNYVGNSIVGKNVNFEAGSICANHFNERDNKTILVRHNGQLIDTKTNKFGALVGDGSKIGANAVLSPGTILEKGTVVKRLELIEQVRY